MAGLSSLRGDVPVGSCGGRRGVESGRPRRAPTRSTPKFRPPGDPSVPPHAATTHPADSAHRPLRRISSPRETGLTDRNIVPPRAHLLPGVDRNQRPRAPRKDCAGRSAHDGGAMPAARSDDPPRPDLGHLQSDRAGTFPLPNRLPWTGRLLGCSFGPSFNPFLRHKPHFPSCGSLALRVGRRGDERERRRLFGPPVNAEASSPPTPTCGAGKSATASVRRFRLFVGEKSARRTSLGSFATGCPRQVR
ncbi:hypothetical protein VT85_05230 [Planctomyces sp. SH-PL62]|nr:hypothetical protein VT85_05230 [Planctomyces sp. SH-PL62]